MWMSNDLSQYFTNRILRDGTPIRIRAIRSDDKQLLARHFDGLGSDSRNNRFFGIRNELTENELRYFTEPDFFRHVALVATVVGGEGVPDTIVSDGRYVAWRSAGLRPSWDSVSSMTTSAEASADSCWNVSSGSRATST